jgi:sugar transferase (PEP-CTERM system associated)
MLALLEGSLLTAAVCGTMLLWGDLLILDWLDVAGVLAQGLTLSVCCIIAFYYNDLYDLRIVQSFGGFAQRLLQAFGVAFIILAGFYTLFPQSRVAHESLVSSLLIIIGLLLPIRALIYAMMRSRPFVERVLILGTSPLAHRIIQEIEAQPHLRYAIVGVASDATSAEPPARYPALGPLARLDKIIEEVHADRIVVAMDERRGRLPIRHLLESGVRGLLIEDAVPVFERLTGKLPIEQLNPSFLIFSRAFRKSRLELGLRRLVSLVTAAIGLVVSAPLMALIALTIKLDSPGPALFVQDRAGLDGRLFRLVKFRTMYERPAPPQSSVSVWGRDDAGRITRVGRWLRKLRLDELPQFWNILKGDMNLVGPRPEMACNVEAMTETIPYYSLRHVVLPGVTGWAQVRYGYSVNLEDVTEKVRHDLYYIKHMSLWLDLRILIDTVKIVLFGRGAR